MRNKQAYRAANRPAIGDGGLEELHQLLRVGGVGPGGGHHLAGPEERDLQSHRVVVEHKHLELLLPQILQGHLDQRESHVNKCCI